MPQTKRCNPDLRETFQRYRPQQQGGQYKQDTTKIGKDGDTRHINHMTQPQVAPWIQRETTVCHRAASSPPESTPTTGSSISPSIPATNSVAELRRQVIEQQLLQEQYATSWALLCDVQQSRAQQAVNPNCMIQSNTTITPIYLTFGRHWTAQFYDRLHNVQTVPGPGLLRIGTSGIRFRASFGNGRVVLIAAHHGLSWRRETSGRVVTLLEIIPETEGPSVDDGPSSIRLPSQSTMAGAELPNHPGHDISD